MSEPLEPQDEHAAAEEDDFRLAFIEAALAAELSIGSRLLRATGQNEAIRRHIRSLENRESLKGNLGLIAGIMGVEPSLIAAGIEAIEIRNRVVHEGYHPDESSREKLYHLLRIVGLVDGGLGLKFPGNLGANSFAPASNWRQAAVRRETKLRELGLKSMTEGW